MHMASSSKAKGTQGGKSTAKSEPSKPRNLSVDCDSDYEDGGPEDESLEMARRTYNQQLSDAFKDGFREGFDKGQIKLAQAVFNEAHSKAAKSQVPYGQYLGILKVLEHKLVSEGCNNNTDLRSLLQEHSASSKGPMKRSALLTRLKAIMELEEVKANAALTALINETHDALTNLVA